LLFVESACEPAPGADASAPLWRFSPRDSCRGDATTKWLPTVAGLEAMVGDCRFHVREADTRGDRCLVVASAVEDEEQAYFQTLDSATDVPGRPNASWRARR
jgi:hypothetical protein